MYGFMDFALSVFMYNLCICFIKYRKRSSSLFYMPVCGLGINAILSHFAIPQLPWHIDTVLVASVFILIGYELKNAKMLTDNIMRKNFLGCIFVIGLIFTYMNTELSFNANIYGNMVFMLIGSFSLSYVCLWICTRIKKSSVLSHFGRGTVIVMAFSYFLKRFQHSFGLIYRL